MLVPAKLRLPSPFLPALVESISSGRLFPRPCSGVFNHFMALSRSFSKSATAVVSTSVKRYNLSPSSAVNLPLLARLLDAAITQFHGYIYDYGYMTRAINVSIEYSKSAFKAHALEIMRGVEFHLPTAPVADDDWQLA